MATITITFDSDVQRSGKTVLAKALYNTLKKLGYRVTYDFKPSTRRIFSKQHLDKVYSNRELPEIEFSQLTEPSADIIIVPE